VLIKDTGRHGTGYAKINWTYLTYFQAFERSENILLLGTNTNKFQKSGSANILVTQWTNSKLGQLLWSSRVKGRGL